VFLIAQALPAPPPEIRSRSQRPLKVSLTLTDPAQLQVREGQSVSLGSILAERTDTRRVLEIQLEQLKMKQQQLDQPTPQNFFGQAQLRELEYQQIQQEYEAQYDLVNQLMALPDPPPAIQRQELHKLHSLYNRLQLAHERLTQAHWEATRQQRNHDLAMAQQREDLTHQIQLLEQEIALTTLRSPVAGTVARIQIVEQRGPELHVEIQIAPR
jgi:multidrug resistance efflux pump